MRLVHSDRPHQLLLVDTVLFWRRLHKGCFPTSTDWTDPGDSVQGCE
jgi:hypothetical protein